MKLRPSFQEKGLRFHGGPGVITASGEFGTSGVVEQEACERRGLPANLVFCFISIPAKVCVEKIPRELIEINGVCNSAQPDT